MMMPPFAVSFSSSLRTTTRSCRGVIFTVISLTLRLIHSKDSNTTGEKSSGSSVALLRGHQSLFSGGRFPSEDPLDPPASWIQSQHLLAHPPVSRPCQAQKSSGILNSHGLPPPANLPPGPLPF